MEVGPAPPVAGARTKSGKHRTGRSEGEAAVFITLGRMRAIMSTEGRERGRIKGFI